MTDRPFAERIRYAAAAVTVVAVLLAASAFLKSQTCGCGSRGLPFGAIAAWSLVAALLAGSIFAALAYARQHKET